MHKNRHIHSGTWTDKATLSTWKPQKYRNLLSNMNPLCMYTVGFRKLWREWRNITHANIGNTCTHTSKTGGNRNKRALSHHMASSSCGVHLCTDEVGLCAFKWSVNEKLYQSISEKLLSVQVVMHRCSYEKDTSGVYVGGKVWFISASSTSSSSSPAESISVLWDDLCLQQFLESWARWWTEARRTQMHTCMHPNTLTHRNAEFRLSVSLFGWRLTAEPCGTWEEGDKVGWVTIKEVVGA